MIRHNTTWEERSLPGKFAHVIERTGLAVTGSSCALFVAALLDRTDIDLLGSGMMLQMILGGALGFYLGIDLPPRPVFKPRLPLLRTHRPRIDVIELLSGSGTFLAAVPAFMSVCIIVLDGAPARQFTLLIGLVWVLGTAMQVLAGILARLREADLPEL